ncbi:MAG: phage tail protein [Pseudobutyrivibrio ruminis]|nr:phage tail protein [Pseudobutyrivibrio ruminis]
MGGYYYETKQGDMWDYIAYIVYKDETKVEVLLNAEENRTIMDTYIFSAGVKVWCPEVADQSSGDNIAPWRDTE